MGGIGIGGASEATTNDRPTDRLVRLRSLQSRGGRREERERDKQKTRFNWPKKRKERTETKRGSGVGTADDVASRGAARDALVCADFEAILWENQNTYAPSSTPRARDGSNQMGEGGGARVA